MNILFDNLEGSLGYYSYTGFALSVLLLFCQSVGLGAKIKKIVPLHPLGRKTPLLPCIRYISLVLGKPCLTNLSVVSFS